MYCDSLNFIFHIIQNIFSSKFPRWNCSGALCIRHGILQKIDIFGFFVSIIYYFYFEIRVYTLDFYQTFIREISFQTTDFVRKILKKKIRR